MTDYLDRKIDYNDPSLALAVDELSFWGSRFGALLFDNLEVRRGIEALDLGCGSGFPLLELAQAHGTSCRFTGVDVWRSAVERANWKRRAYGLDRVGLAVADAASLPFADARFDLIVSNLVVNNLADPRAVLAECARVAKPGARIALTTNLEGHFAEFYAAFRETLVELGLMERCRERLAANEGHRGTRESVCGLLEGAGWSVSRAVEDRFQRRYADGGALLRHYLTVIGFLGGWRRVVGPEDEAAVFAAVEEKLDERARREGELRMTVPMLFVEAVRG